MIGLLTSMDFTGLTYEVDTGIGRSTLDRL